MLKNNDKQEGGVETSSSRPELCDGSQGSVAKSASEDFIQTRRIITSAEFRNYFHLILQQVYQGQELVLKRRGVKIAMLRSALNSSIPPHNEIFEVKGMYGNLTEKAQYMGEDETFVLVMNGVRVAFMEAYREKWREEFKKTQEPPSSKIMSAEYFDDMKNVTCDLKSFAAQCGTDKINKLTAKSMRKVTRSRCANGETIGGATYLGRAAMAFGLVKDWRATPSHQERALDMLKKMISLTDFLRKRSHR